MKLNCFSLIIMQRRHTMLTLKSRTTIQEFWLYVLCRFEFKINAVLNQSCSQRFHSSKGENWLYYSLHVPCWCFGFSFTVMVLDSCWQYSLATYLFHSYCNVTGWGKFLASVRYDIVAYLLHVFVSLSACDWTVSSSRLRNSSGNLVTMLITGFSYFIHLKELL